MSDTLEETGGFPATLDLSSADTSGNEMENGWKDAVVFEVKPVMTDNPGGNLPMGTPGLNVQFKIEGGKYDNRRVFNRYWMPGSDYDKEKREKLLGFLARFLIAAGFPEAEVKSASFDMGAAIVKLNTENPPVQVNTKYDSDYDNNRVNGVKARSGASASTGSGLL